MTEGTLHEYKEKVGACADCGNSPVNHFESYCSHTLSVWTGSLSKTREGILRTVARRLAERVEMLVFRFIALLPFTHFSHDPGMAVTYRSQVVWEEALRRGIQMEQLVILGVYTELYRARVRGAWRYFQSLPIRQSGASVEWMDDKYRLKNELRAAGIATPRAISVVSERQALEAFGMLGAPVVVKPRLGSRGRHTTVNVRTEEQLKEAFRIAQQLCRYVVVEEYLEGSVCRGTVVGGKLAGFFQAHPPRVVGDGVANIRELVAATNARKPERVQDIVLREDHEHFLKRLGLTPESVLPHGTVVTLTHRTGRLFGGRTRELLGSEHPVLRAELERAAALLGTPIVGFDMMIANPEADPHAQRWGIIEANSLPYIDLHYLPLEGEPSIVAKTVWEYIEAHPDR